MSLCFVLKCPRPISLQWNLALGTHNIRGFERDPLRRYSLFSCLSFPASKFQVSKMELGYRGYRR